MRNVGKIKFKALGNKLFFNVKSFLFTLVIIILLCPFGSFASDGNGEAVREYVKAERAAGRIPNLKRFSEEISSNLSHLDLSDVDLSDTLLVGGDFTECDLRRANLTNAHIAFADFVRADIRNADFSGVNLDRCSFEYADLRGVKGFGSDSSGLREGVKARGANLSGVDLRGAILRLVDLQGADLSKADMTDAILDEVNLHGANITDVICKDTLAINAEMSEDQRDYLSQRGAIAKGQDLENRVANGVNFSGKDWMNIDVSNLNLKGALLNNVRFSYANLSGTQLQEAQLDGAKFAFTIFEGIDLSGSKLRNCELGWYQKFSKAKLCKADFTGSTSFFCKFIDSDLSEANFSQVDLNHAEFIRCNLSGTNFDGANVKYALFENNSGITDEKLAKLISMAKRWHLDFLDNFGKVVLVLYIMLGICGIFMFFIGTIREIIALIRKKLFVQKS